MNALAELFGFALAVTGPTFCWVLLGAVTARLGWLPPDLNHRLSMLVFRFGLPLVLFFGAARVDYRHMLQATYLIAAVVSTLSVVALAEIYGRLREIERGDRAVFVQAAYRSNLGVMGIALAAAAYGAEGLALAALPVAVLTLLYNVIAVPVLGYGYSRDMSMRASLRSLLLNPLIIGIGAGVVVSLAGVPLLPVFFQAGDALGSAVIPLSLVCIGAGLNIRALRRSGAVTLDATLWRLLIGPAISMLIAVLLGVHGAELAVLFLLLASPAAAASYIMVAAAGGNSALAANVVVITTLLSSVTITLGLALLQLAGLV